VSDAQRAARRILLILLILATTAFGASPLQAQRIVDGQRVEFAPSPDNDTVVGGVAVVQNYSMCTFRDRSTITATADLDNLACLAARLSQKFTFRCSKPRRRLLLFAGEAVGTGIRKLDQRAKRVDAGSGQCDRVVPAALGRRNPHRGVRQIDVAAAHAVEL
jgi:hypothetical protein